MAPTESSKLRESLGRKLTKRRGAPKRVSMDIPERLQDGDDAAEDVTASSSARYMNQSIFNMITAAGSTADFQSRFDEPSSESEDEGTGDEAMSRTVPAIKSISPIPTPKPVDPSPTSTPKDTKHRRASSTHRLMKSMHKLRLKPIRERKSVSSADDHMSASQILTPPSRPAEREEPSPKVGDAPMMSRILQAEAEMKVAAQEEPSSASSLETNIATRRAEPVKLSQRLMDIFGFDEPEDVISEWPCWLLQSVLVQGFLYVTQKHICFYAYLPKKAVSLAPSLPTTSY